MIEQLTIVFGAIGGASGFVTLFGFLYFRKQTKRLKNAEAAEKEIGNYDKQIERYEKRLHERDSKVDTLYIELRNEQKKNLDLIEQLNNKELEYHLLEIQKCEERFCSNRKPPSEYNY